MLTHTEAAATIETFDTRVIEALLDLAETEGRDLVNLYTGADRAEKIQHNREVVAVLSAELDARADDDELIAAIAASPDFVTVQDADHLATLLDVDEDEKAPAEKAHDFETEGRQDERTGTPCAVCGGSRRSPLHQ